MHWYGGSIAEAVTLSKQKDAIFVVFIEGDNDLSKELAKTIDTDSVLARLSNQDNFLAIKLKSGTENYTYFAQIYQFVPVPSIFFIGRNGTPLEVVCAGIAEQNLATRIDLIMEEHCKDNNFPVRPTTSGQSIKEKTQQLLQSEANVSEAKPTTSSAPVSESLKKPSTEDAGPAAKVQKTDHETKSSQESEVVCEGDVCVRRPKADQAGPSQEPSVPKPSQEAVPSSSSPSVDDKIDRAKELIEIKRQEKAEKEKQLQKQKELERRSVGQGVAELKRWQEDQELKQIQEERKREKLENSLARQRILDQIAQDRAERRAREQPPAPPTALAPPSPQPPLPNTPGDGAEVMARLQLKLPDGGTHTAQFPAGAALADVQRYIADHLQMPAARFSLWTAFPRRELADAAASLLQLQLVPSAALLLLPRPPGPPARAAHSPASLLALLTQLFTSMILDPTYQVFNWIRERLFPRGGASEGGARGGRAPPPPGGLRRRGNVHRLHGDPPTDDDNNTWNGNSTQQM